MGLGHHNITLYVRGITGVPEDRRVCVADQHGIQSVVSQTIKTLIYVLRQQWDMFNSNSAKRWSPLQLRSPILYY